MLGFSHIAWALNQVTKGGGRVKLAWGREQQWEFHEVKHRLCSTPILSFLDLQKSFNIETYASDYVVGVVITQHGNLVVYHSETLSYTIRKYPNYDKEIYSMVQDFC
jgi:hypothetical protein